MSSEDVWVDCLDAEDELNELERERNCRQQRFQNEGYREGLQVGEEETLQQGFDVGYAQGMAAGYEWGFIKGSVAVMSTKEPSVKSLRDRIDSVPLQQLIHKIDNPSSPESADVRRIEEDASHYLLKNIK